MEHWHLDEEAYKLLLGKLTKVEQLLEKQNGRIGSLERWRSFLAGVWFVIAFILGWMIKLRLEGHPGVI